jgi:hypothetical protein
MIEKLTVWILPSLVIALPVQKRRGMLSDCQGRNAIS